MAMQDGKYLSANVSWKQWTALASILVVGWLIIYFEAIVVGYVLAVLALSTFFMVVAFDIGVPNRSIDIEASQVAEHAEASDDGERSRVA